MFVAPQEFSGEIQAVTTGAGHCEFGGVFAEHDPSHPLVPVFVCPQELAEDVQDVPNPLGFAGVVALHEPLTTVPEFV